MLARMAWLWIGAFAVSLAWGVMMVTLTAWVPDGQRWRVHLAGFIGGLVIGHYVARIEAWLEREV